MTIIHQSALLPYPDRAMFDLVNDIESYPLFMDGCLDAEVISSSAEEVKARLCLGTGALKCSFTTCNHLDAPRHMTMELLDGPFGKFDASWTFTALREDACKVELHMNFEFSSGLLDIALTKLIDASCRNLVNAVIKRAEEIYRKK